MQERGLQGRGEGRRGGAQKRGPNKGLLLDGPHPGHKRGCNIHYDVATG